MILDAGVLRSLLVLRAAADCYVLCVGVGGRRRAPLARVEPKVPDDVVEVALAERAEAGLCGGGGMHVVEDGVERLSAADAGGQRRPLRLGEAQEARGAAVAEVRLAEARPDGAGAAPEAVASRDPGGTPAARLGGGRASRLLAVAPAARAVTGAVAHEEGLTHAAAAGHERRQSLRLHRGLPLEKVCQRKQWK